MTSEVSSGADTMRGLKALADSTHGKSRQDDLVKTVSAILSPDAKTALERRAGSMKIQIQRMFRYVIEITQQTVCLRKYLCC